MTVSDRLAENLAEIRSGIVDACSRAGRSPAEVTLVAVTKYAHWDWVQGLIELGCRDLGEARPQQLVERSALAADTDDEPRWHLIGHLQRNKVRPLIPVVHQIHSVDSLRLLDRIVLIGREENQIPELLLEVNISGEEQKDGFDPDALRESVTQLIESDAPIVGLMGMASHTDDEDEVRRQFRSLSQLREDLRDRSEGRLELPELSIGMSGDYGIAIEEGSTAVRIGSALFAGLQ